MRLGQGGSDERAERVVEDHVLESGSCWFVNVKTAKTLGLTIPAVLLWAAETIQWTTAGGDR